MTPLVLLHGFTGAPSSWDEVVARLPRARRVVRPALMGHAGAPITSRAFDDEVDRIAELVARERLEGAHLVGYSLGARIALGLVVRHPRLASTTTWISGSPGIEGEGARAARRAADAERAELLAREGIDPFVRAWEQEPIFETQRMLSREVQEAHRARRSAHDPTGLAASLRILGQGSMPTYDLSSIAIPVTLIVGSEDPKARGNALRMTESLARARIVVVRSVGHDVVLERPAEVAALLVENGT